MYVGASNQISMVRKIFGTSPSTRNLTDSSNTATNKFTNSSNIATQLANSDLNIRDLENISAQVQGHILEAKNSDNYSDWQGHYQSALENLSILRDLTISFQNLVGIDLNVLALDDLTSEIEALISSNPFTQMPDVQVTTQSSTSQSTTQNTINAADIALVETHWFDDFAANGDTIIAKASSSSANTAFELVDDYNGLFSINSATGEITAHISGSIDASTAAPYQQTLEVRAISLLTGDVNPTTAQITVGSGDFDMDYVSAYSSLEDITTTTTHVLETQDRSGSYTETTTYYDPATYSPLVQDGQTITSTSTSGFVITETDWASSAPTGVTLIGKVESDDPNAVFSLVDDYGGMLSIDSVTGDIYMDVPINPLYTDFAVLAHYDFKNVNNYDPATGGVIDSSLNGNDIASTPVGYQPQSGAGITVDGDLALSFDQDPNDGIGGDALTSPSLNFTASGNKANAFTIALEFELDDVTGRQVITSIGDANEGINIYVEDGNAYAVSYQMYRDKGEKKYETTLIDLGAVQAGDVNRLSVEYSQFTDSDPATRLSSTGLRATLNGVTSEGVMSANQPLLGKTASFDIGGNTGETFFYDFSSPNTDQLQANTLSTSTDGFKGKISEIMVLDQVLADDLEYQYLMNYLQNPYSNILDQVEVQMTSGGVLNPNIGNITVGGNTETQIVSGSVDDSISTQNSQTENIVKHIDPVFDQYHPSLDHLSESELYHEVSDNIELLNQLAGGLGDNLAAEGSLSNAITQFQNDFFNSALTILGAEYSAGSFNAALMIFNGQNIDANLLDVTT